MQDLRDHLHAHGQAVPRPARRHRGGGLARQVERIGVVDPRHDVAVGQLRRRIAPHVESGDGKRRRQEQIVVLEKGPHLFAEVVTRKNLGVVIAHLLVERTGQDLGHRRVEQFGLVGEHVLEARADAGIELRHPDRQRVFVHDLFDEIDRAAQVLERPDGIFDDGNDFVGWLRVAERRTPRQAHAAHRPVAGGQEIGHGLRDAEGVAAVVSGDRAQQERRVANRPRERADMSERRRGARRIDRDTRELRLDAEQAAERARDAHGPTAVGSQRKRRDPGRDAGRGAAARPARSLGEVPGVGRDPGQRAVADRLAAELAGRGLADDAGALPARPVHRGRVDRRHIVRHGAGAEGQLQAVHGDQVLDRNRQAVQQAEVFARHHGLLGLPCRLERQVRRSLDETVERGLQPFHPLQGRPDEVDRRDFSVRDQILQLDRRHESEVAHRSRPPDADRLVRSRPCRVRIPACPTPSGRLRRVVRYRRPSNTGRSARGASAPCRRATSLHRSAG